MGVRRCKLASCAFCRLLANYEKVVIVAAFVIIINTYIILMICLVLSLGPGNQPLPSILV